MVVFPPPSSSPAATGQDHWDSEEEEDGLADQSPLDVSWVPVHTFRVAVSSLPGNRFAGARRSMVADLVTLKEAGVQDVLVLCTDVELARCKVPALLSNYMERGMTAYHHPTDEDTLLNFDHWVRILSNLCSCLQAGRKVLVHCVDGYGWSCMLLTLLAMLLDENLPAEVAIEIIRQHRGLPAVQTVKQYNFIMDFRKHLSEFNARQHHDWGPLVPSVS